MNLWIFIRMLDYTIAAVIGISIIGIALQSCGG